MKVVDRLLGYYSLSFSLLLTLGGIASGVSLKNLITTLVYLPVTLYFLFSLIRAFYIRRMTARYQAAAPPSPSFPLTTGFDLAAFFRQRHPAFLATLCLYSLVLITVILKTTLPHLIHPEFVSPLPTTHTLK